MFVAVDPTGDRVEPRPHTTATCPICRTSVRAKCGRVVTWHWAHIGADCDDWAEPDSTWHRNWQALVPIDRREVVIGNHRADVIAADGTVLELQHSYLPAEQITAREAFYGRMIWLFDARGAAKSNRLIIRRRPGKTYQTFRWKHPRKSISLCRKPVFLDLGDNSVFLVKKIHLKAPCGGWGYVYDADTLVKLMNSDQSVTA